MILADRAADADLAAQGFTTIPLLGHAAVEELRQAWSATVRVGRPAFDAGLVGVASESKRMAHDLIVSALGAAVRAAVPGHRPLVGSFAVKRPDPDSAMPVHQDWCVVDEGRWSSISIWCALDDVGLDQGPLCFWPGSHQLTVARGSGLPDSCARVAALDDGFVAVPLSAGEAAVYFHATVHRSPANRGTEPRVGAMLGLVPDEAEPVHLHLAADGALELRRAGTGFYLEYPFGAAPLPASASLIERRVWDGRSIEVADLRALTR